MVIAEMASKLLHFQELADWLRQDFSYGKNGY